MLRMLSLPEGIVKLDSLNRVYLSVTQGPLEGKDVYLSDLVRDKELIGCRVLFTAKGPADIEGAN